MGCLKATIHVSTPCCLGLGACLTLIRISFHWLDTYSVSRLACWRFRVAVSQPQEILEEEITQVKHANDPVVRVQCLYMYGMYVGITHFHNSRIDPAGAVVK